MRDRLRRGQPREHHRGPRAAGRPSPVSADADESPPPRRVLPGVGAAAPAMAELDRRGLVDAIRAAVDRGAALLRDLPGDAAPVRAKPRGRRRMPRACARRDGRDRLVRRAAAAHGLERRRRRQRPPARPTLPAVCYFAHSYVVDPAEPPTWWPRPSWTAAGSPAWSASGARRRRPVSPREERPGGPGAPARVAASGAAMLRRRVIPCLDVRGGRLVKGVKFRELRDQGDPVEAAERLRRGRRRRDRVAQHLCASTSAGRSCCERCTARPRRWTCRCASGGGVTRSERARDLLLAGRRQDRDQHRRAATGPSW